MLLAASAEIEQYQRVRHESVADLHVVGHAVGELVHLMAELLENATAFSRPDTACQVTARAEGGGALVEIADAGLGMSPTALAQANAVLAAPPAADVAAIERMGHFVVSHLAARHGVGVRLTPAGQGLVARIALPGDPARAGPRGGAGRARRAAGPTAFAPVNPAPRRVEAARQSGPVGPADLPVAGRPPQQWPGVPDQRPGLPATLPVRAADVLAPMAPSPADEGGGWWSRQGPAPSSPVSLGESTPAPPSSR